MINIFWGIRKRFSQSEFVKTDSYQTSSEVSGDFQSLQLNFAKSFWKKKLSVQLTTAHVCHLQSFPCIVTP